jgi:hypothetical protein
VHPAHPVRVKAEKKITPATSTPAAVEPVREIERRRVLLTPGELERFSADHAFVGTVVLVEVPFDAVDPLTPEQHAKARPALIVAAGDAGILVRGIYSNPSSRRVLFQPWRRLGFDHVSYVDDQRTDLEMANLDGVERLGRLSDDEWNALF